MTASDNEIIENIRKGDTASFRIVADELKDKAFSLIMKILKNKEEAEDTLQEAFMKLYKAITDKSFEERSKLSTYFYTIVYNTAIDNYKKLRQKRFSIISIDVEDTNFNEGDDLLKKYYETEIDTTVSEESREMKTDSGITENEINSIIQKYISSIPEQYAIILNMFYVNDLSHEEICGILKLPLGTVKNRLFRAKAKLKEIILKKYPEEEILQYI